MKKAIAAIIASMFLSCCISAPASASYAPAIASADHHDSKDNHHNHHGNPPPPPPEHRHHHHGNPPPPPPKHRHHHHKGKGYHECTCRTGCMCCRAGSCNSQCTCAKTCRGCRERYSGKPGFVGIPLEPAY